MQCPACSEPANTFFRFAFTRQGVSLAQGMKGYSRCQHCGTLLRFTGYRKQMWSYLAVITILYIALSVTYVTLHRASIGIKPSDWILIGCVLAYVSFLIFGMWKYRVLAKAAEGNTPVEKSST